TSFNSRNIITSPFYITSFTRRICLKGECKALHLTTAPNAHGDLILRVWSYQSRTKLSIVHNFDAPLHKTIAE
ncbi:hypothetical protein, partial [Enterobacter hormaechei]|uniref:hypothetical protein n=1 Tax=Enterobacter hormaechei TaxID=158836 RepID=UPI0039E9EAEB